MVVSAEGRVTDVSVAEASVAQSEFQQCVVAGAKSWDFGRLSTLSPVSVKLHWNYKPL